MAQVELPVVGMTCRSCELRVGRALRRVPGVEHARVSAARGRARVTTSAAVPRAALVAAVERAGYRCVPAPRAAWLTRDGRVWRDVALGAAAVALVVALARGTGWDGGAPAGSPGAGGPGLLVAAGLGLAAGVSTCAALVGGLVLGAAARHAQRHPDATARERWRPHLAFALGRLAGFAAGGAALGLLGATVRVQAGALALVQLVAAAAMVTLGLQLTSISPRLAHLTPALPGGLARRLGLDAPGTGGGTHEGGRRRADLRTGALGAATFLVPCGITQVVQLAATATGDAVGGALVMTAFALGTAPGLLGLAGVAAAARGRAGASLLRIAGVAVLALAVTTGAGAAGVLGRDLGGAPAIAAGTPPDVDVVDGVQVLRTAQDAGGYSPAHAVVQVGVPVRWEVDSVAPGCASALSAPDMDLGTVVLGPGVTVLEFTPERTGRLTYACAMGMFGGVVDVVEAPAAAPAAARP